MSDVAPCFKQIQKILIWDITANEAHNFNMSSKTMVTDPDPFTHLGGWSVTRSLFKAFCWAIDGLLAFSIPLIAFEAALKQSGVSTMTRYAMISLATGVVHQIVFPAFERLQTLTTMRAIPVYHGNWWLNFIVFDHVANELTSFIVVGGIQALCSLWVIKDAALSLTVLMLLEPVTFFFWALSEDLTNIFILRRRSEPEAHQQVLMSGWLRLVTSFQWSLRRLLMRELWLYNLTSIIIKVASTYFTYWAGDEMLSKWAGVTSLNEAQPEMRALIAFLKIVIFFETFLFIGIRCPDAVLDHLESLSI